MNKTVTIQYRPEANRTNDTVQLHGIEPAARLTPKMARQALKIANGLGYGATVWDTDSNIGYRVYRKSARKIRGEW